MKNKLIVLFLLAIGLVGYDWYYNQPSRRAKMNAQDETNNALRADLATAIQARDKVGGLKQDIEQTNRTINQFLNRLPMRSEAGALLEQITTVKKGIRFESITPGEIVSKTIKVKISQPPVSGTVTYEQLELALNMIATFRELGKYLDNIEKIPRLVEVVGLKMTSSGAGKPMTVKMTVKTYIYGGR